MMKHQFPLVFLFVVLALAYNEFCAEGADNHNHDEEKNCLKHLYLPTLDPAILIKTIEVVAKSRNIDLQNEYDACEEKNTARVLKELHICCDKINPDLRKQYEILAEQPEKIDEFYECSRDAIVPLSRDEKLKVVDFEDCVLGLAAKVGLTGFEDGYYDEGDGGAR